jgi:AcrR family transcriptional regulator
VDRLPEHLSADAIGRRPLAPTARAAHQRRRILVGATREFVARGYWETTVDHIVAAAQVGVGSFYQHFEDKEDCFLAAFERAIEIAAERFANRDSRQQRGVAVLAAIDSALWLAESDPLAFQLAAITAPNASPRAQARHEELVAQLEAGLRGQRQAARPLPESLERGLIAGASWALGERVACGQGQQIAALREELVLAVLGPYLGARDARNLIGSRPGG